MHQYFTPLLTVMIKTVQVHITKQFQEKNILYSAEELSLDRVASLGIISHSR
jgi:hypothetical protein